MSKTIIAPIVLMLALLSASAGAEVVGAKNIAGVYEGTIVSPSPAQLGLETYIIGYELKPDGSLSYTEFRDNARTEGITGGPNEPACPGTYTIEGQVLKTVTDCSRYSTVYRQEIDLRQATVEELMSATGKVVSSKTTLFPNVDVKVLIRKLK